MGEGRGEYAAHSATTEAIRDFAMRCPMRLTSRLAELVGTATAKRTALQLARLLAVKGGRAYVSRCSDVRQPTRAHRTNG